MGHLDLNRIFQDLKVNYYDRTNWVLGIIRGLKYYIMYEITVLKAGNWVEQWTLWSHFSRNASHLERWYFNVLVHSLCTFFHPERNYYTLFDNEHFEQKTKLKCNSEKGCLVIPCFCLLAKLKKPNCQIEVPRFM